MNVRIGTACLLGLALAIQGCASGPGPEAVQPQAVADEDLPAWVSALPEGIPPQDNDYTNRAALFLAQEQYEQALGEAQSGIGADSTNAASYFQAGQAYLGMNDYESADAMFDQAEELYPRMVLDIDFFRETEWIENFNEAVSNMPGNVSAAISALERAHSIYQKRPEAMVQLGALYSQNGDTEAALEMFRQAIEMIEGPIGQREEDPEAIASLEENLNAARFNLGQIYFDLERYPEAAEIYQALVDEDPDDLMAYSNLGAALVSGGDAEGASTVYSQLLARPGLTATDYNMIAVGAYNGDLFRQAAQAFGLAYQEIPQNRDFIFNQAQALYLAEDAHAELAEVAAELIAVDPHNRNARQFLIQALARLDRVEEAASELDELEAMPFDVAGLQLVPVDGGVVVPGVLTNRNSDVGDTVTLRFSFYDTGGMQVGTQDITLELADVEVGAEFEVEFPTTALVLGYSYEVI